jgi:GntR family transcriptional regulator
VALEPKQSAADRLRDDLVILLADQGLLPGDRIPTEPWLADHFGVGRSTVREALKRLEHEGLVRAVQGRGRFLSAVGSLAVERPITKYEGIEEMLTSLGYRVSTAVLSVEEIRLTSIQAATFGVNEGDEAIRLVRLRYGDEQPMVYSVNLIPRDALPGPIVHRDWTGSVTEALEAHGHQVVSSLARISAVNLPADIKDRYSLGGLGPWLLVTETCLTSSGRRVLLAEDYHRGGAIGFNVLRRR